MTSALNKKLGQLSSDRQKKIRARADELIAEAMTLRDLRKAMRLTQTEMGAKLKMNQESISRLERRSDLLLSTLVSYIRAMGGDLQLTAKFPDRPAIKITRLDDLDHS